MSGAEFLVEEEEEDFPDDSETIEVDEIDESEEEGFAFLGPEEDDLYGFDSSNSGRTKRVNARRALEDYFEEKLRREEENYFDDFSIPLDDD